MSEYVIIGNGIAAAGCIEGIRAAGAVSEITVISEENRPVYCRPLISYCLEGKTSLDKMNYRADDFYEKNGCRVIYGKRAVKIENDRKRVILDDETQIEYRKLCIAAGSSPFIPPFDGIESVKSKFTFMTADDMLALEKALSPDSRVLIVGAGLIGLKCAEGISGRVGKITVCDLAPRILSSILDDECAAFMQKRLEEHKISFMLSDSVEKFNSSSALMKSGKTVDFDILVLAVGVRANTALIKDSGGEVNRGIIVDDGMHTSVSDIYAAGDCTEGNDISFGKKRVLAILPNAYMQGKCAGINMAGGSALFNNAIPMNSIGFFGLHAMTAGSYFGNDDGGEMFEEKSDKKIKRLYIKDGFLTGFIIIGEPERAGIYTSMIREKTPIAELDFENLKKVASLSAFSEENRRKKLGGVV